MSNEPVKVTLLPSEQVVEDSNKTYAVTDTKGRVITMKKPGILDQFDLVEVLGDTAANDVYRLMCIPILYVVAIDGDPVEKVGSNREMRALIQRIGEEGFQAIQHGIATHFRKTAKPGGEEEPIKK